MKRKTKKQTTGKVKTAQKILNQQKKEYQAIFKAEVRKSRDSKEGAKRAGEIYRKKFGYTASARWKRALRKASVPADLR